ncbi:hypothetical protein VB796_04215 [Arcicella sp. LKC2W]|uniref:AbiTii domain-containing protein n=1 Tax=Arcicella sp. LKC2W TaxID=2984198 RepID=UPI002B21CB57|nr:hypothetical protein [Arcicella sp. LKC2W]MEA5458225.1 hypothetical protein [Arcicella sp. LKC2W]
MNQTIDWINTIINELVEPKIKLKDTLLKVQVLAFKIKNEKLKEWVENELNGFVGKEIPSYRKSSLAIFGNLSQNRGFGSMVVRNNHALPIEYLEDDVREAIMKVIMISSSVSELEHMIEKGGEYQINIPHFIHNEITKLLSHGWVVDSAWQKISSNGVEGILSSIKSKLLTFMLELADEIGEKESINIMEHKNKINNLFDKTIGNLSGEIINISIGTDNVQSVNTGNNAKINIAKGKNIEQAINVEAQKELSKFIEELKLHLDKLSLVADDRTDIINEISRIETQLSREEPKYPIINEALKVVNGILIGVAGNAFTPPILEKLSWLIGQF